MPGIAILAIATDRRKYSGDTGGNFAIPVSGLGAKFCIMTSCMWPYFSCNCLITNSESISSSCVSPMPTSRPVVIGILSSPALSSVFILTFGFLLGASSCGMPFSISRSLDVSSISPRLTLISCSIDISFLVRLPAFVCGSNPVFSRTSSLMQ